MKIGLIREWKQPADKRVALTPEICAYKGGTDATTQVD